MCGVNCSCTKPVALAGQRSGPDVLAVWGKEAVSMTSTLGNKSSYAAG